MASMKSHGYEQAGQIVSGIDVWMPPQPPRRRCIACNCYLRQGNLDKACAACERKVDKRESA